ncbi:glycoside hydrolase family 114 protein [Piromyces sp. E2]|nr:glycoside hydrolase family 114 protein [Piromyces sp. E2]|eukprot:OUM65294.1 glycoside hydrolase family 114 protein [Piromyces sp. E2]
MKYILPVTLLTSSLIVNVETAGWKPKPGLTWDYLLGGNKNDIKNIDRDVVTFDLEYAEAMVPVLHKRGQKAVFYFSGGTTEYNSSRPDIKDYKKAVKYGCDAVEVDALDFKEFTRNKKAVIIVQYKNLGWKLSGFKLKTLINPQKNGNFTCILGNHDLQSHSDNYNCNTGTPIPIKGRSKTKRSFDSYSDSEKSSDNEEYYEYDDNNDDNDTYTYPEEEEVNDFDDSSNIEESNDEFFD